MAKRKTTEKQTMVDKTAQRLSNTNNGDECRWSEGL